MRFIHFEGPHSSNCRQSRPRVASHAVGSAGAPLLGKGGGASENQFDVAIIVSSDGDFLPPAKAVAALGKRIEALYFRGSRPFVMQEVALMREIRRSLFAEQDKNRTRRRSRRR